MSSGKYAKILSAFILEHTINDDTFFSEIAPEHIPSKHVNAARKKMRFLIDKIQFIELGNASDDESSDDNSEGDNDSLDGSDNAYSPSEMDSFLSETIEKMNTQIPQSVDQFIQDGKVPDPKEYIGLEVGLTHTNEEELEDDLISKFKERGIHVQSYSSGNVRFRIQSRPTPDQSDPISEAVNRYYDYVEALKQN